MALRAKDFARRPTLAIATIVLVALVVRGVTFAELRRSPAFETLKGATPAIYVSFGHHLFVVYVIQILLGTASCVMLWYATRKYFSSAAALAAGLLLAVYPPGVFFDLQLGKLVLDSFLLTSLLAVMAWIHARPR